MLSDQAAQAIQADVAAKPAPADDRLGAILTRLQATLAARRDADAASSYVASLHARGEDHILKKVGEEATEFLLAAKSGDAEHLVKEAADVWFHMLVLMSHKGLGAADILSELARREGLSGLTEKAARPDPTRIQNQQE